MDRTLPVWKKVVAWAVFVAIAAGAFWGLVLLTPATDPDDPEPAEYRGW